jgi:hypothetical protein
LSTTIFHSAIKEYKIFCIECPKIDISRFMSTKLYAKAIMQSKVMFSKYFSRDEAKVERKNEKEQ